MCVCASSLFWDQCCGACVRLSHRSALQKQDKGMRELLTSGDDTQLAVEFAAACGAITTLNPGAIAAQPKLHQVEEMVQSHKYKGSKATK